MQVSGFYALDGIRYMEYLEEGINLSPGRIKFLKDDLRLMTYKQEPICVKVDKILKSTASNVSEITMETDKARPLTIIIDERMASDHFFKVCLQVRM